MQTEGGLRDARRASKGWIVAVLALLIGMSVVHAQPMFSPAPGRSFAAGDHPWSVAVGDFRCDGRPDLATANAFSNDVTVLLCNGGGGFTPTPGTPVGRNVEEVCHFLYA